MYPPKNTFIIYPNQIPLLLPVFPRLLSIWHVRKAAMNSGNQQYYFTADIHIPYSCFSYMFYKKQQHHVTAYLIHLHCPHLCFSNH